MKHIVIGQVKHDGKLLKIGSQIELDEDKGARLARDGFVVPTKPDVPAAAESEGDDGKKAAK